LKDSAGLAVEEKPMLLTEKVSKREKISWRFYMGIFRRSLFIDSPPFYFHQKKQQYILGRNDA